jgi:hypothetical protein
VADSWWVVFNPQISAAPALEHAPSKAAAVAEYFRREAGGPTGSQYPTRTAGPYATRADAQMASGRLDQGAGAGSSALQAAGPKIGTTLGGLTGWDAIKVFVGELSDGAMWRSAGWLILGVALMIGGVALWVKQGASGSAAAALAEVA